MQVQQIVRELGEEIARLREARALLAGEAKKQSSGAKPAGRGGKRRNRLSDAGRRRISAALKRRWAERRAAGAKAKKSSKRA